MTRASDRVGAIILARLDSSRLPGKVLADVHGAPLLWYLASRLPTSLLGEVVLATTDRRIDDPLADTARQLGLKVFRGELDDVAGRFVAATQAFGLNAALRVNADSPFLEPPLLAQGLALYRSQDVDLVTNLQPRTHPYGVSLEVVRVSALIAHLRETQAPDEREHVTRVLYRRTPSDRIMTVIDPEAPIDGPQTRVCLTIDEPGDLAAFRQFVGGGRDRWASVSYRDAVQSGLFRTL